MNIGSFYQSVNLRAAGIFLALGAGTSTLHAAPVITAVNADIATSPLSFSFLGSTFTVDGSGSFPNYLMISTLGKAAVRTVFGTPSTDFTNRGTVVYDQNILGGYGSFPAPTTIPYTNGENFLGLRVASGGQDYYGLLFTTNTTVNSYGFEAAANTAITATTTIPSAVPEPTSWALLVGGFGMIGGAMRRRSTKVAYA